MRAAIFVLVAVLIAPSGGLRADDPPTAWEFTGRTETVAVEVRSRVTGHLTRVAVREGGTVKKGDLLAEIDSREYQLNLDEARAGIKMAEARAQEARIKAANTREMLEKRAIGPSELQLATAAEAAAEAGLVVAEVEARRAELTLSWTRIVAPINGRVSLIETTEGGLVAAAQTPILTVVATEPLYATFGVPESILLQLRRDGLCEPGKLSVAVGFATEEGYPHAAELDLLGPEVDPRTGSARFRATVPNPEGLLSPGMSARVRLTASPK